MNITSQKSLITLLNNYRLGQNLIVFGENDNLTHTISSIRMQVTQSSLKHFDALNRRGLITYEAEYSGWSRKYIELSVNLTDKFFIETQTDKLRHVKWLAKYELEYVRKRLNAVALPTPLTEKDLFMSYDETERINTRYGGDVNKYLESLNTSRIESYNEITNECNAKIQYLETLIAE